MTLWERFYRSGLISDYLRYRRSLEDNTDADAERADNKRRSKRGEQ